MSAASHEIARSLPDAETLRRLQTYLARHVAPLGEAVECRRFEGGQSNPTFLLKTQQRALVLRCKPQGPLLQSAHAIDREYRVLHALHGSGVPVPEPCLYCADHSVIGTEFYVMQFVPGRTFFDPALPELDQSLRAVVYDSMNDVLVGLATVDLAAAGLADFGRRAGFFERQVRRWTAQYRAAETHRREHVEALIDWLPRNLPADDGRTALMHGDFRLDNVLIGDAGHAVAVLDWELSTIGHPLSDLAYQCAQWRLPVGRMRGLGDIDREAIGIPCEARYVERFCRRVGMNEAADWTFHLVLSLFRLASICQGVYRRGLDGNASSNSALDFDQRTAVIAEHAVAILDAAATDHVSLGRAR